MTEEQFASKLKEIVDNFNKSIVNRDFYFAIHHYNIDNSFKNSEGFIFNPSGWMLVAPKNWAEVSEECSSKYAIMMRNKEGQTIRPLTLSFNNEPYIFTYGYEDITNKIFVHFNTGRIEIEISPKNYPIYNRTVL